VVLPALDIKFAFHPTSNSKILSGGPGRFPPASDLRRFDRPWPAKIPAGAFASDSEIRSPSPRAFSNTVALQQYLAGLRAAIDIQPSQRRCLSNTSASRPLVRGCRFFPLRGRRMCSPSQRRAAISSEWAFTMRASTFRKRALGPFRYSAVGIAGEKCQHPRRRRGFQSLVCPELAER